jgi:dTDP-4-dehydrorhamnose 3,5-epimerase
VYNQRRFADVPGLPKAFVQENQSRSHKNVLRGLHYQIRQPQGKLVRVILGRIFDVAVDLRRSSPTFGKWVGVELSEENRLALWIPVGFAHGFLAMSDCAIVQYKVTDFWATEQECTLAWNDPAVGIDWPLEGEPMLSEKDRRGVPLGQAEVFD